MLGAACAGGGGGNSAKFIKKRVIRILLRGLYLAHKGIHSSIM